MIVLQALKIEDLANAIGGSDGPTIVGGNSVKAEQGPNGTIADIQDTPPSDRISIYVVREGDTLVGIAKMFGVSVNTLLWANNIGRYDVIRVGQNLMILPVSGIQYQIKEGDTIQSIAKKWNGDADEIIQFNNLSPNQPLAVGTTIIIPDGEAPIPPSTNVPSGSYRGGSGPSYIGYYMRPVSGGYNSRATASNPHGLHGYNAVDLAVSCGTPIVASASGDVLMARSGGWNGGYGNFIIIDHPNGTQTLYAHNSSNIVGTGWHVVQGQVIGYVGITGNTTGCHVHFEIRGAANPF
jgi:murein DD-endopeptidase MepM/ murein hydrolase activator NlpD